MSRETHVQFCEGLGVQSPGATHLIACVEFAAGLRAVFKNEMNEKPATKSDTSIQ